MTYEQRKKNGRTCHTIWLDKETTEELEELAVQRALTKAEVIAALIKREATANKMLTNAAAPPPPRVRIEKVPARSVVAPGSPAELAQKVMDGGGRREAKIVSSGRRVIDGREQR